MRKWIGHQFGVVAAVLVMSLASASAFAQSGWQALPTTGHSAIAVGAKPGPIALATNARVMAIGAEKPASVILVHVDTGATLATISLTKNPRALAIDSQAQRIYVADEQDGTIKVIDVATAAVVSVWSIGGEISALALSGDGAELIAADRKGKQLVGIATLTGVLTRTRALGDKPEELIIGRHGTRLLIGLKGGQLLTLDALDWTTIGAVTIGDEIRGLAWWDSQDVALAIGKHDDALNYITLGSTRDGQTLIDGDPKELGVDQADNRAYVAAKRDLSVNRIDLVSRTLAGRYPLPGSATGLIFDPLSRVLLLPLRDDRLLLRIDPQLASLISQLTLGKRLTDITVNPLTDQGLAVIDKSSELAQIQLADGSAQLLTLPLKPSLVAVDSAFNRAVVVGKKIMFVDLGSNPPLIHPLTLALAEKVKAIAVDSTRGIAVVVGDKKLVSLIDTNNRSLISSEKFADDYDSVAIHSARGVAYLGGKNRIAALDLATGTLIQTWSTSMHAEGLAVDEGLDVLVITEKKDAQAHLYELNTFTPLKIFDLPKRPGAIAIQSDTHTAVIASKESDVLSLVNLVTHEIVAGFVSIKKPFALAVSERRNQALVLSGEKDEVTFVQLPNPAPLLDAISPTRIQVDSVDFVITANGAHFVDGASIVFGGTALGTRWLSNTQLEANVPARLLSATGVFPVLVRNPAPAGGNSATINFEVLPPPPTLTSVTPALLEATGDAQTITLTGANITPTTLVVFDGQTIASQFVNAQTLTATVPGTLLTADRIAPVWVVTVSGQSNTLSVTIETPVPVIDTINPAEGAPFTQVTLTGRGFDPVVANNEVVFGGSATAEVVSATPNALVAIVPATALTGPVSVTTSRGTGQGPVFTVIREQDFALFVTPAAASVFKGASTSITLQASSTGTQNFTGLATLTHGLLPDGVGLSFSTPALSATQNTTITIKADASAATGSVPLTITGTSLVSGVVQTRSATINLDILPSTGVTGVKGRFVTPDGQGIANVIVAVNGGPSTQTDSAGNFVLTGVASGTVTLRMDATPANPLYPIWPYSIDTQAGKVVVLDDWTINPPPPDERFTPISNVTQDQTISDARFPGLKVTLPAGASIVGWDGVVKTRIAVERVDLNKMTVSLPPVPIKEAYQLFFGTPMGGIPSVPIPVSVPNVTGLEPGQQTEIWYFDGSPMGGSGEWKLAGPATVSDDGATVSSNAGAGIPRFCGVCGLFAARCPALPSGNPTSSEGCKSNNPVDLLSGYEMPNYGGLTCGGIVPRAVGLSYNPVDGFQGRSGLESAVGSGWILDYDIVLADSRSVPQSKRLILPPNDSINFVLQRDGSYIAPGETRFDGAVLRSITSSTFTWELTFKGGRKWRFGLTDQVGLTASFLLEQVDARGNVTRVERRASDRKITRIGDDTRAYEFTYGPNNLVSEIRDSVDRSMQFTYNTDRRIETMTDADGRETRYTYVDDNEFPASAVCPQGTDGLRIKTIEYPGRAQPTINQHGTSRRVLRQVAADGVETRFEYKLAGACVVHESSPGQRCTGPQCPDTDTWENHQAGWHIYGGQVVATTTVDASGRRTRAFSATGFSTATVDGLGQGTNLVRDGGNRVIERTDALNRTWKYLYDANGNVTQETDPLNRVINYSYDATNDKVTSVTRFDDANQPQSWQFTYDPTNATLLTETNPLNQTTSYTYTPRGELQQITDPLAHASTYAYNAAGDLTQITDPLGNLTRIGTDGAGRPILITDPLGHGAGTQYNGTNSVTQVTDARNKSSLLAYDAAGRIESVTNARNAVIETYAYDSGDRLVSRTDATNKATNYTYDSVGRLATMTDRRGLVTSYAYDAKDRVVSVTRPDGVTRMTYDAVDRLVQISDPAGTISYSYDAVDRLTREVQFTGGVRSEITYSYDALDRRISRTVNGVANETTTYGYDAANRLTSIGYRGQTTSFEYDAAGRLIRKVLPNGIVQALTFDAADRLGSITYARSDSTIMESVAYTYDANGRRVTEASGISPLPDIAFTANYDAADRMTDLALTATGQNFILTYDDNGNLASKTESTNPGNVTTYTWDSRNRLTRIDGPALNASFEYDAMGRRSARTINGATTRFVYDGMQAIAEIQSRGTSTLVTGLGLDEVIARYSAAGARTYLTNALNSVLAQTRDDQTVQNFYAYSPYGASQALGPDEGNPIQYTARENDGTGLYFYRARYYDPVLKRFVSEDPIGIAGGTNVYAYVGGDPVSNTDSSGLIIDTVLDVGFVLYDAYRLLSDNVFGSCDNLGTNLIALGADTAAIFIPGVTGAGIGVRATRAGGLVASNGTKITGYTKHGLNRAIGDGAKRAGVKPSSILDTIKNPKSIKSGVDSQGRPYQVFTGNTSRVVVNPNTGQIVSVNPLGGSGVR